MTIDDIHRRLATGSERLDAIYMPEADINALLRECWHEYPGGPPAPPVYDPGKEIRVLGVTVGLLEVLG